MTQFTPWSAAAGGALIGAAAALLWVALGRIAGISGILGGLAGAPAGERGWRLAFLAGLVRGPAARRRGLRRAGGAGRGGAGAAGPGRAAGRLRHPARHRLHQRARRLRHRPALAALDRGDGRRFTGRRRRRRSSSRAMWLGRALSRVPRILAALAAGLLFGLGLVVSGMVNPAKGAGLPRCRRRLGPEPRLRHGGGDPGGGARLPARRPDAGAALRPGLRAAGAAADRRAAARRRRALRHRLGAGGLSPARGRRWPRSASAAGRCWASWRRCWPGWGSTAWPRAAPRPRPGRDGPRQVAPAQCGPGRGR